jgi:hypothetical protein
MNVVLDGLIFAACFSFNIFIILLNFLMWLVGWYMLCVFHAYYYFIKINQIENHLLLGKQTAFAKDIRVFFFLL